MNQGEKLATVYEWIREATDQEQAELWLWNATCYPFGPATDSMLEDGLRVASGELLLDTLLRRVEEETDEAMRQHRENNE